MYYLSASFSTFFNATPHQDVVMQNSDNCRRWSPRRFSAAGKVHFAENLSKKRQQNLKNLKKKTNRTISQLYDPIHFQLAICIVFDAKSEFQVKTDQSVEPSEKNWVKTTQKNDSLSSLFSIFCCIFPNFAFWGRIFELVLWNLFLFLINSRRN